MIRNGQQYRDSIRDSREIYMNGERVKDVTAHPMFKPLVDIRARLYAVAPADARAAHAVGRGIEFCFQRTRPPQDHRRRGLFAGRQALPD